MEYFIGVDIGTTSTKAVLYDRQATVIDSFNKGYSLYRNPDGMAEQEPEDIVHAVEQVIHDAGSQLDFTKDQLLAVSFSCANQNLLLLDRDFQPQSRIMTWADTRARDIAEQLKKSPLGKQLYFETGTPIHPMSPLTKLMWIKQNMPGKVTKDTYISGIKAYIFYRFFHVHKVDVSIASCTGMMDLKSRHWDPLALNLTGVTKEQMPKIVDGTTQERGLIPEAQEAMKIPATTPFIYGAFDGALSNLGVGALDQDTIAITIGTSAAVRITTDHPVIDPQERLFCYAIDNESWVVGGSLNNGGAVYQWAVNHFVDTAAAKNANQNPYTLANEVIENTPAGAHGLIFLPFLGGERAPLWNADARGSFFGLNYLHTRSDMLRSVMEGINLNIETVFEALTDLIGKPKTITATGGFARSKVWRQMLADILNMTINIPQSFESGCLGAVLMAMKSLGIIEDYGDIKKLMGKHLVYYPNSESAAVYQRYLPLFKRVEQTLEPLFPAVADLQEKNN